MEDLSASGSHDLIVERGLHRGPLVIKAWAPWCSNCGAVTKKFDVAASASTVSCLALNVDDDADLAALLGVRSVPTLIALRDGRELGRLVGDQSQDAISSLFEVADMQRATANRRSPLSLTLPRALAGGALAAAGFAFGSVVLGLLGVLILAWAALGVSRH